jgi:hypothetical protein
LYIESFKGWVEVTSVMEYMATEALPPLPPSAEELYTVTLRKPGHGSESAVYFCTSFAGTLSTGSTGNESMSASISLIAVKVFTYELAECDITPLRELKDKQKTEQPDHPCNRFFPKLLEVNNPTWQAMEAIQGPMLANFATIVQQHCAWGAVFTCHVFLELHAAICGLLDLGLYHQDFSNTRNIMFRYRYPTHAQYELPGLVLVDLTLAPVVHEKFQNPTLIKDLLWLCSVICKGVDGKTEFLPIVAAVANLVGAWDVDVVKKFDEFLAKPETCQMKFRELGQHFHAALDDIRGRRHEVTPWPGVELEKLLK